MNLISPNRSQTYDLLFTGADALLLNYKGLVGEKNNLTHLSPGQSEKKCFFLLPDQLLTRLAFATASPIIRSGTLESKVHVEVLIQVVAGNQ